MDGAMNIENVVLFVYGLIGVGVATAHWETRAQSGSGCLRMAFDLWASFVSGCVWPASLAYLVFMALVQYTRPKP